MFSWYFLDVKPKTCIKVPVYLQGGGGGALQPLFSDMVCYQSDRIWCTNQLWAECLASLICTQSLMSWFWANGPSTVSHGSWEVDFFKMVKISNLDCLFPATNIDWLIPISGRGLWLYSSAKYSNPQWYHKVLVRGLHIIMHWLHKIMQMSSWFDYVKLKSFLSICYCCITVLANVMFDFCYQIIKLGVKFY